MCIDITAKKMRQINKTSQSMDKMVQTLTESISNVFRKLSRCLQRN